VHPDRRDNVPWQGNRNQKNVFKIDPAGTITQIADPAV
jgi:hypothetical protein